MNPFRRLAHKFAPTHKFASALCRQGSILRWQFGFFCQAVWSGLRCVLLRCVLVEGSLVPGPILNGRFAVLQASLSDAPSLALSLVDTRCLATKTGARYLILAEGDDRARGQREARMWLGAQFMPTGGCLQK